MQHEINQQERIDGAHNRLDNLSPYIHKLLTGRFAIWFAIWALLFILVVDSVFDYSRELTIQDLQVQVEQLRQELTSLTADLN